MRHHHVRYEWPHPVQEYLVPMVFAMSPFVHPESESMAQLNLEQSCAQIMLFTISGNGCGTQALSFI